MNIHHRIKKLRQEKGWTQKELAEKLNIHQMQVSTYERGVHDPSIELLVKISELFDVSLDYFIFDTAKGGTAKIEIKDRDLLRQFETVDRLGENEREFAKQMLDLLIVKSQFQKLLASR